MVESTPLQELPCRTLDELVTFHQFEPEELTVVTEGPSDRGFVAWFLEASGVQRVAVYDVSSLLVSIDDVANRGYENNNRGRVLTAAAAAMNGGVRPHQMVCLIDKDLDALLGRSVDEPLVLATDFACLEMYAMNLKTLGKFVYLNKANLSATAVIESLTYVLHRLFLARGANALLAWALQSVQWTGSVELSGGVVVFDEENYIGRYLLRNGRFGARDEFTKRISELAPKIDGDTRDFINGEDFVDALGWLLRKHKSSWSLKGFALRDSLLSCIEHSDLRQEAMFRELYTRLTESPEGASPWRRPMTEPAR